MVRPVLLSRTTIALASFAAATSRKLYSTPIITPAEVKARSRQKRGAANAGRGKLPDAVYDQIFFPTPWYMLYPHSQHFIYIFSNLVFCHAIDLRFVPEGNLERICTRFEYPRAASGPRSIDTIKFSRHAPTTRAMDPVTDSGSTTEYGKRNSTFYLSLSSPDRACLRLTRCPQ